MESLKKAVDSRAQVPSMVSKMAEDVVSREEFASVVQALTLQMETLGTPAAEASAEKPAQTAAAKKTAAAKAKAEPAATEGILELLGQRSSPALEAVPVNPITAVPLHLLMRRRRQELGLRQSALAEALHVTPECIGLWEAGRRRMDLSKLPRIAAALDLDPRQLCAIALAEFHPLLYASLFDDRGAAVTHFR